MLQLYTLIFSSIFNIFIFCYTTIFHVSCSCMYIDTKQVDQVNTAAIVALL